MAASNVDDPMRLAPFLALVAGLAAITGLSACGKSDDSSSGDTGTTAAVVNTIGTPSSTAAAAGSATGDVALPEVSGPADAKPTIKIPSSAPPATLQAKVITKGTGAAVAKGDTITIQYVGVLWRDGKEFDSSWSRGQTASFPIGVGQLIAGWDEAIPGMTYGSRVLLVVPPDKGYGSGGQPAAGILGTDTMVFVVDILSKA